MSMAPLLVELFTEELPPKALKKLGEAFAAGIYAGLVTRGLVAPDASVEIFATPRRLATKIANVSEVAPDRAESKKLMPAKVAFDANGAPTPALQKRLEKEGATLASTALKIEGNDQVVYLNVDVKGASLADALQAALDETINKLPIPKLMTYQLANGLDSVQFVRPALDLVALHGASVVPVSALGLQASNVTHGHRFQGEKNIVLNHADEYETRLENEGGVVAAFDKRRHEIERLLFVHAEQCGDTLGERDHYLALLDEVTALVEMPTVYVGKFEQEFLEVPAECLILTMKLNQKYFPMFFSEGGLSSRFLIVSNMRLDDPRNVIEGNQRVVRPRLADARFFFETDKKTKLADRLPKLANVVYHNKLGSQGERIVRLREIAKAIAQLLNKDEAFQAKVDETARLAKADLVTDMVGEFPELQGTMGKYYALTESIDRDVAEAIEDHYKPKFAGDTLPRNDVAMIVALADKLETLVGMFGIGQVPTGDKDPFALRRQALGVLRILIERQLPFSLDQALIRACSVFKQPLFSDPRELLLNFFEDRLRGMLREQGYTVQEVEAVLAGSTVRTLPVRSDEPVFKVLESLKAVRAFAQLPQAARLAAANKRIENILAKGGGFPSMPIPERFVVDAERLLFEALTSARSKYDQHVLSQDLVGALRSLAVLEEPVDRFFKDVMVNVDDVYLRSNRIALLEDAHLLMNRIADLSKLAS